VDSPLPHPGWLVRADAFATVGPYVDSRDVPEDYEWLHRFFATARARGWRAGKPRGGALLDRGHRDVHRLDQVGQAAGRLDGEAARAAQVRQGVSLFRR
jgi:hypothetical protein